MRERRTECVWMLQVPFLTPRRGSRAQPRAYADDGHRSGSPAETVRQIKRQGAVAARGPRAEVAEMRRHARATPQEQQIKESSVACTEQRTNTVGRDRDQQHEQVLAHQK